MYLGREREWRRLQPLFLNLVWVGLIAFTCALTTARASTPPSSGVDAEGNAVDPLHATPGKAVVLIFVRTDCPISNRYAPTVQQLSARYAGKATFWLVYPDKAESATAIQLHLHEYGYTISALRDPQHSLVKLGEAQVTPEAAVFDESGALIYHGRIDNWYKDFGHPRSAPTTHELDDAIQAALSGKKPDVTSATGIGCYISDLE
jgi:thiol-disulfide isomerase/thioredoxin